MLRGDFVSGFIELFDVEPPMAALDWAGALGALTSGELACSSSEEQLLRVAASLAEGISVDLRDVVCGLDRTNASLIASVLMHAAGHGAAGLAARSR